MEQLIALKDINDTIKAGDHFEAPDLIYVAVGLAAVAAPPVVGDLAPDTPPVPPRRRGRGRQAS